MIKAIVFDCFGVVLADSLQVLMDELERKDQQAADEARELVRAVNKGLVLPAETRPKIAKLLGLTVEEYHSKVRAGEVKDIRLMQYIQTLRPAYKTAMLSNIGADSLLKRFTEAELTKHFDTVVASGEIGFVKPEPEAYEIVAQRLGVRLDECLFTDDRELFCVGATSVGMQAILYTDFVQFKQQLEALIGADSAR